MERQWKFRRLKQLSDDQLRYVNNALSRGENALDVARQLHEWGMLTVMTEAGLAKHLAHYRMIRLGAMKPEQDLEMVQIRGPQQEARFDAMNELRLLAQQQRVRVNNLLLEEDTKNKHNSTVTNEMGNYASLLKDVLKAEFDCGEREFKGPLPGKMTASVSITPGGGQIDVTLRDAVASASEILAKHQPRLIEGERV